MSGAAVFNEEDQMKRKIDRASVIMGILLIFSLTGVKSFAIVMKNRISPMKHKSLFQVAGVRAWILIALAVVLLLLIIIKEKNEMKNAVTGLFASVYAGLMIVSFGVIVQKLTEGRSSGYRVTFGISIYIVMLCCYAIIIKCNENIKKSWVRYVNIFTGMFIICGSFIFGVMDKTSLMIEFHTRQEQFYELLREHFGISVLVLLVSVVIGIPLGYLCYRYKTVDTIVMGILNVARSIPSIALIMVMVIPLSFLKNVAFFRQLGIGAFGFAPVFCALFLYALFQIINSLNGALKTIDPMYIKTAKAMGMTDRMILFKVQLPMVLPVIISGIRVALIFTFTAASLGTLVGFGGLGTFIAMGSNGAVALDMILLGAVPIMIMIFITDFILTKIGDVFEVRISGKKKNRYEESVENWND